jgi:hypothetical protein
VYLGSRSARLGGLTTATLRAFFLPEGAALAVLLMVSPMTQPCCAAGMLFAAGSSALAWVASAPLCALRSALDSGRLAPSAPGALAALWHMRRLLLAAAGRGTGCVLATSARCALTMGSIMRRAAVGRSPGSARRIMLTSCWNGRVKCIGIGSKSLRRILMSSSGRLPPSKAVRRAAISYATQLHASATSPCS